MLPPSQRGDVSAPGWWVQLPPPCSKCRLWELGKAALPVPASLRVQSCAWQRNREREGKKKKKESKRGRENVSVLGGGRGIGRWAGLRERARPLFSGLHRSAAASPVPPRSLPSAPLPTAQSSSPDASRTVPGTFPEDAVRGAGAGAVRAAARPGRARRAAAAAAGGAQRGPAAQQGERGPRSSHPAALGQPGGLGGRRGGRLRHPAGIAGDQELFLPRQGGRSLVGACLWLGKGVGSMDSWSPAAPRAGEHCWKLGAARSRRDPVFTNTSQRRNPAASSFG